MARKRVLKDAAKDPVAKRESLKATEKKEKSKGGYSKGIVTAAFVAGLIGGMISFRYLRLWFLKI